MARPAALERQLGGWEVTLHGRETHRWRGVDKMTSRYDVGDTKFKLRHTVTYQLKIVTKRPTLGGGDDDYVQVYHRHIISLLRTCGVG